MIIDHEGHVCWGDILCSVLTPYCYAVLFMQCVLVNGWSDREGQVCSLLCNISESAVLPLAINIQPVVFVNGLHSN